MILCKRTNEPISMQIGQCGLWSRAWNGQLLGSGGQSGLQSRAWNGQLSGSGGQRSRSLGTELRRNNPFRPDVSKTVGQIFTKPSRHILW